MHVPCVFTVCLIARQAMHFHARAMAFDWRTRLLVVAGDGSPELPAATAQGKRRGRWWWCSCGPWLSRCDAVPVELRGRQVEAGPGTWRATGEAGRYVCWGLASCSVLFQLVMDFGEPQVKQSARQPVRQPYHVGLGSVRAGSVHCCSKSGRQRNQRRAGYSITGKSIIATFLDAAHIRSVPQDDAAHSRSRRYNSFVDRCARCLSEFRCIQPRLHVCLHTCSVGYMCALLDLTSYFRARWALQNDDPGMDGLGA